MADSWSEYIDLISDASMNEYADNRPSKFTNKLPCPQSYPAGTSCGLQEMEFIHSWYNVTVKDNNVSIFDFCTEFKPGTSQNPLPSTHSLWGKFYYCPLKEGYYETFEDLCKMINEAIQNSGVAQVATRDVFTYDPVSMKFSFNVEGLYLTMFLRGDILNYLGLQTTQATLNQYVLLGKPKTGGTYQYTSNTKPPITETRYFMHPSRQWSTSDNAVDTAPFVAQITLITSFCVYVDVIESQITGDTYSDALRIVAINKRPPGTNAIIQFHKPYYLKLNKLYIPSISVEIRSLAGDLIDFKVGRTRLKLKFVTPSSLLSNPLSSSP